MLAQRPPSPRSRLPPPAVDLKGLQSQWARLWRRFAAIKAGPVDRRRQLSRYRTALESLLEEANAFSRYVWEQYLKCLNLQNYSSERIVFAREKKIAGYEQQEAGALAKLAAVEAAIVKIWSQTHELVTKIKSAMPQFVASDQKVQTIVNELNSIGGERIMQRLAEIARQLPKLKDRANQVVQHVMVPRMVHGAPAPGQPPPAASRDSNITLRNNLLSEQAQLNRQLNRWHYLRNLILKKSETEEGGAAAAPAAANILKPMSLRF